MIRYVRCSLCAATLFLTPTFATLPASAAMFVFSGNSSDGHAVAGTATFTLGAGTATVTLSNTTATTLDAGELLTGIDFNFGGLTPSLTSKTGIERTVTGTGSYSDTGSAQNLTWSLVSLGGATYQLNFNPDASDSIIGPPAGGNYSGANGSINGNNGHNPFAAQAATFVLNVPSLTANSSVTVSTFRYGTTLDPANGTISQVPEPSSLVLLIAGIALAIRRRTR